MDHGFPFRPCLQSRFLFLYLFNETQSSVLSPLFYFVWSFMLWPGNRKTIGLF
jgi:hypothetical protein